MAVLFLFVGIKEKPMSFLSLVTLQFTKLQCGKCGCWFAIESKLCNKKIEEKACFFCPNGCERQFASQTEAEKWKHKADQLELDVQYYKREIEKKSKELINTKGQMTKIKKRIDNGVCSCCHRHFTNLERHMKTKHPKENA